VNEPTLIHKFCHRGDTAAAQELLQPYERPLFNYLWQMLKHTQDTEDALQDTLGKALQALPRYREENHFKSWLFRIGHNVALDTIRQRKRMTPSAEVEELSTEKNTRDGSRALEQKERHEALAKAIQNLPDPEREVVTLRLQADLPFKEIATITGAPLGTVLARMHYAKQHLKSALTPTLA